MHRMLYFILALLCLFAWRTWSGRPLQHAPGVLVPEAPRQALLASGQDIAVDEFMLSKRARFELRARVLGKERYWWGVEAQLSPVDLALGWGVMSDQSILDRIDIRQGNRWYFTRYELPAPVSDHAIIRHSANMHIVPAGEGVADEALALRPGDVVNLAGYLVDVAGKDGFRWHTSLTREDTGGGSCEIFYVERILREARP